MRSSRTRILRPAALAGIVWTALAVPAAAQTVVQVTEDIGQDAVWMSDNTYVLNGFVFVDDGATLTIEAGTVVRGKPGQAENASALIVPSTATTPSTSTRAGGVTTSWFVVQAEDIGDRAGEHDGGTDPEDGTPYATPKIWNATFIGSGVGAGNPDNPEALKLRDNWAGSYFNSIFTDFAGAGVDVEDLPGGEDSRNRLEEGTLKLQNNLWWGFGAGDDVGGVADCSGDGCGDPKDDGFAQTALQDGGNRIEDPQLRGISRTTDGGLDPRPAAGGPATSGALTPPDDGFYTPTSYLGAFSSRESELWIAGWTFISELGVVVQGDFMGPDTAVRAEESSLSSAVPGASARARRSSIRCPWAARSPSPSTTAPVRSWPPWSRDTAAPASIRCSSAATSWPAAPTTTA